MSYKNFDEAQREIQDRTTKFTFEGRDFEVNLNVKAGPLLRWMRSASKVENIPGILELFFNEEELEWLLNSDADWPKMEELLVFLSNQLGGGPGKTQSSGDG